MMTGREPKVFSGDKESYALLDKNYSVKGTAEEGNDLLSRKSSMMITGEDFEKQIERGTNLEIEFSKIFPQEKLKQFIKILKDEDIDVKISEPEVGGILIERFADK